MSTVIESAAASTTYSAYVGDRAAPAPAAAVASARRRLPWGRILAGVAAVAVAGTGLGLAVHHAAGFESTDDSFLEGNVHPVSARISGTVARVLVDDNAHVVAGQPVLELDPADLNLAVAAAAADLAQAHANASQVAAQILRTQADITAATARIAQNAAQLRRAELDFHRVEVLASDAVRASSRQDLDVARATFNAAQAAGDSLTAERAAAEAALVAVQAQRAATIAQVQKAEAALATAKLQVDYTVVRAPSSGHIARKSVEVGQRLQPGQPVLAVVGDDVWVIANFKEKQLAHLRVGQRVDVEVDAMAGRSFPGVVESFSPGTGARFSLLPPDNATGNFTKVVQRVPVKIVFLPDALGTAAARLSPGLSTVVTVSVR